jgi:hypothetical protein
MDKLESSTFIAAAAKPRARQQLRSQYGCFTAKMKRKSGKSRDAPFAADGFASRGVDLCSGALPSETP